MPIGPRPFRQTRAKSRKIPEDSGRYAPIGGAEGQKESPMLIRIAVYESSREPPRVLHISGEDMRTVIEEAAERAHQVIRDLGARISFIALRETVENLVHARLQGATVSILDGGRTVVVSDRGPGIPQKEMAFVPGFSTAPEGLRKLIRGVGSGLPVALEAMGADGGFVALEDNLEGGTVVTLSTLRQRREEIQERAGVTGTEPSRERRSPVGRSAAGSDLRRLGTPGPAILSHRQQQVLALLAAMTQGGPTAVAREMGLSLATAHRELTRLEEMGLVLSLGRGKRSLSREGIDLAHSLFPG